MTTLKYVGVAIAGIVVGSLFSVVTKSAPSQDYSGVYNQVQRVFDQAGVHIGPNGTNLNGLKVGGCTIYSTATTIAASSSAVTSCQAATDGSISGIAGITTDSVCTLQTASSTNPLFGGLLVGGVSASTTQAGTLDARIYNATGGTFTWSATASSSVKWNYSCFDPA